MAEQDRVAGIYSEVKYRFDKRSIQNLRKFKRDLMELKTNLKHIQKMSRKNVKIGFDSKNAQVSERVAKASKKTNEQSQNAAKSLGKQNKLRENSLKLQTRQARQASQQAKVQQNAEKSRLATEKAIAAQQAKVARMSRGARGAGADPKRVERLARMQMKLNNAYKDGAISARQFNSQSQRITNVLRRQQAAVRQNTMSFNQMRSAIAGATGAYSAFAGAAGISTVGGQFESARIMLETAVGAEQAGETMQFLIDQSKRLGIDAAASAKGFARYSLAGKQLGFTNEELQQQYLGLAESMVVFGLRQDEMLGVLRAAEQIMSKNQVMALNQ